MGSTALPSITALDDAFSAYVPLELKTAARTEEILG